LIWNSVFHSEAKVVKAPIALAQGFIHDNRSGTHTTSNAHTCAEDALIPPSQFGEACDDLTNASWRNISTLS
jgi:hypothetical protein